MKRSLDIIGLPVITLNNATTIGTVKCLVVDSEQALIAALVLDDGQWYYGAMLIPFSAIAALGENALIIKDKNSVKHITADPDLERHLIAGIQIIGAKALTTTGKSKGVVNEFLFRQDGKITACEIMEPNGEIFAVPIQSIHTFGKDVLIMEEEKLSSPASIHHPAKETLRHAPEPAPIIQPENNELSINEKNKKFDDKHRKFLLGKKAGRRIETDNGMLIVESGCEITEEVLQKARLAGKFVELSMSIS